jgi:hypothetical protein
MYQEPSRANLRYAGRIQIVIEFLLCLPAEGRYLVLGTWYSYVPLTST